MEKSEKNRFHSKPKTEPTEKMKIRNGSKKQKNEPKEKDDDLTYDQNPQNLQNPPSMMIQSAVPIMQAQYYGMQPQQMMPYPQPILMNGLSEQQLAPNPYILNQIAPVPHTLTPLTFGYYAKKVVCPYCQVSNTTKIEESFNCCTFCTYVFISLLIPILLVLLAVAGCNNVDCRGGCDCDCNCRCCRGECDCKCCIDTRHYCSNCGKLLGSRDSCFELCPWLNHCIC